MRGTPIETRSTDLEVHRDRFRLRVRLVLVVGREFELGLEGIVKCIDVIKILAAVGVALPHLFDSDQVVNQFAEVAGRMDAPAGKHDFRQVTVLFDRIQPTASQSC